MRPAAVPQCPRKQVTQQLLLLFLLQQCNNISQQKSNYFNFNFLQQGHVRLDMLTLLYVYTVHALLLKILYWGSFGCLEFGATHASELDKASCLCIRVVIWSLLSDNLFLEWRGIEMLSRTAHNIKICLPELGLERYWYGVSEFVFSQVGCDDMGHQGVSRTILTKLIASTHSHEFNEHCAFSSHWWS